VTQPELAKLIKDVSVRDAYGYRPTIVIQGMTRDQLSEIVILAQMQLISRDPSLTAHEDSPITLLPDGETEKAMSPKVYLRNPDPRDQSGPTC
jgi:hypothetical protein